MKPSDAIEVITAAALVDKRTVGESEAEMWAAVLPEWIRKEDALEAVVRHYRTTRDWLMPVDVIELVRTIRSDRVRAAGEPQYPDGIAGSTRWQWRDAWTQALFAGETVSGAEDYADVTVGSPPRHGSPLQLEQRRAEIARLNPVPTSQASADDDERW